MSLIGESKPLKVTQLLIPGRVTGGNIDGALLKDNKFVQSLFSESLNSFVEEALDAAIQNTLADGTNFVISIVVEEPGE